MDKKYGPHTAYPAVEGTAPAPENSATTIFYPLTGLDLPKGTQFYIWNNIILFHSAASNDFQILYYNQKVSQSIIGGFNAAVETTKQDYAQAKEKERLERQAAEEKKRQDRKKTEDNEKRELEKIL